MGSARANPIFYVVNNTAIIIFDMFTKSLL